MSDKKFIMVFVKAILAVVLLLFILPALLSEASNLTVGLALIIILGVALYLGLSFKHALEDKRNEKGIR